jgi:hypothetical protein
VKELLPSDNDVAALRASVSARANRLRRALDDAGLTDATEALTMAGLRTPVGPPSPQGSAKFLSRADGFLAALEIGLHVQVARERGTVLRRLLEGIAERAEYIASGSTRTLSQLRHLEEDFLVYWNEASDSETRAFWEQVHAQGLPYQRVDHLGRILARGRIASRTEYEFAVDTIVLAEQDSRLTHEDAVRLSQMIGAYDRRRR